MNRLVREHYPVSKLPEDLREGFEAGANVRVTVDAAEPAQVSQISAKSLQDLLAIRRPPFLSADQIDAHVRKLRDEWD